MKYHVGESTNSQGSHSSHWGKDNIASFAHCATRLRIMVNNKEKIDQKQVENIDKVKGAFSIPDSIRLFLGQVP